MTPRKLTPAEALAMLREYRSCDAGAVLTGDFNARWSAYFPFPLDKAFAALEEALAQKPTADVDVAKAWAGHVQWMAELEARDKALLERIKAIRPTEPAAPAPSDEEIVKALRKCLSRTVSIDSAEEWMRWCIVLLARRIGVQGVLVEALRVLDGGA